MKALIALFFGTFASEDLTCITAGQLIHLKQIGALAAILACLLGIYAGDLALWLTGWMLGPRLLTSNFIARRLKQADLERFGQWFDRNSAAAILCSRFIPGARLPMYLAAGALGRKRTAFMFWTLLAATIWTPLIVLCVAALGGTFAEPFRGIFGNGAIAFVTAMVVSLAILALPRLFIHGHARMLIVASISKVWQWEFWPAWLFYLPLVPWIGWLALRHRSFMLITAANPGIPHGGIVGESKFQILSRLSSPHVLPSRLIHDPGELSELSFPIVLKPDAGQRGASVRIVRSLDEAKRYFDLGPKPILAQQYHPGPYEAGIFYYRIPGERRGKIFSITDKQFPILAGDGTRTLRQLIWDHPRFRMQAAKFLDRHADQADRVLAEGERFQLARAGNHCQGTMFLDGQHLITPELEAAIDAIARTFDGFRFGRFDVRYGDVEAFKAGRDFAIVELNGVTSESTNVYDPGRSIFFAYKTLFRQWGLLFEIGAASRRRGFAASRVRDVVAEIVRFYGHVQPDALSD